MRFHSILFPSPAQETRAGDCPWLSFRARRVNAEEHYITRGNKTFPAGKDNLTNAGQTPAFYADTGLDSILEEVLNGKDEPALRRAYYALSADTDTVLYRQDVMRALEREEIATVFLSFCRAVESAVRTIDDGQKAHAPAQRDQYAVDGAVQYCGAIRALLAAAGELEIPSDGLRAFVGAVRAYAAEPRFAQTEALLLRARDEIGAISFSLRIRKGKVIVGPGGQGGDFVRETYGDLIRIEDSAQDGLPQEIRLFGELMLNPLGSLIVDALQNAHPAAFALLQTAAEAARGVPEPFIRTFTEEIRFYVSFLDTVRGLRARGLPFAYPALSAGGAIRLTGLYDMDLALQQDAVVPNDFWLSADERGIVVTGANHSGKTTFIRAIGQIAALAALGLPVSCAQAEIPLFRRFFSHFSDAEEGAARQGRLKEELLKLRPIRDNAGDGSLVLLNEMFSSTTAQDAQEMAARIIGNLTGGGARVLCVTHGAGPMPEGMVSMAAQVAPQSRERLYKVVRAPAETHAHVDALIGKYRLTYRDVKERIGHGV